MLIRLPVHLLAALTAFATLATAGIALAAPVRLDARFDANLGGLTFGSIDMSADFDGPRYRAESVVRTEGIADVVLRQIFDLEAEGLHGPERMATARYRARNTDQDNIQHVDMIYEAGAPTVVADPPYDNASRVPVSQAALRQTVDPLSSMLVPGTAADRTACERTVPVYDGRRRYDFRMRYVGMSEISPRGSAYAGPAVRCSAILVPIAGYKRDTIREMRRDPLPISVWLAPVEGAGVLVPVRIEVATPLGTLVARASRFDVTVAPGSQAALGER